MYAVICTGKNLNYGIKGKRRLIPDTNVTTAIRNEYVYSTVKYAGWGSNKMGIKEVIKQAGKEEIK